MIRAVLLVVVLVACGDDDSGSSDDGSAGASASVSELDVCEGASACIFGSADPAASDSFIETCVTDGIFAPASPECRACMLSLSCADLEAAIEGNLTAQAMCPSCE